MLYLISGASRSGKTLLARKILAERQIPYLSLDWLMMGFTHGIPEYGIHPLLWPDKIAEKMAPFQRGMIDNMLFDGIDYVIEGEAMMPGLTAELMKKYPGQIKPVFLGFTEITVADKFALVHEHSEGAKDWLMQEDDDYIRDHIGNMIVHSKNVRKECKKHALPYIDTSEDFLGAIETASDTLLAG